MELQFDKFIDVFLIVRDKLELEESVHIFQRVFQVAKWNIDTNPWIRQSSNPEDVQRRLEMICWNLGTDCVLCGVRPLPNFRDVMVKVSA